MQKIIRHLLFPTVIRSSPRPDSRRKWGTFSWASVVQTYPNFFSVQASGEPGVTVENKAPIWVRENRTRVPPQEKTIHFVRDVSLNELLMVSKTHLSLPGSAGFIAVSLARINKGLCLVHVKELGVFRLSSRDWSPLATSKCDGPQGCGGDGPTVGFICQLCRVEEYPEVKEDI